MKNRHCNRCMIEGTQLYPEFTAATAPMLPQWLTTEDPCQSGPHTAQPKTMGSSSWSKMLSLCSCKPPGFGGHGQGNCSQDREAGNTAPQPNCPEVSTDGVRGPLNPGEASSPPRSKPPRRWPTREGQNETLRQVSRGGEPVLCPPALTAFLPQVLPDHLGLLQSQCHVTAGLLAAVPVVIPHSEAVTETVPDVCAELLVRMRRQATIPFLPGQWAVHFLQARWEAGGHPRAAGVQLPQVRHVFVGACGEMSTKVSTPCSAQCPAPGSVARPSGGRVHVCIVMNIVKKKK